MIPDITSHETIDRNKRLLALALDSHLIYPRKKEKIENILKEKFESGGAPVDVMDICMAEKVLTEEKAAYLLALDEHMQIHARDQLFGQLAVANGLASKADIDSALSRQKALFPTTLTTTRIGEILVDRHIMTRAEQTAILLTQNRIRKEQLLSAMTHLGRDPSQQELINKRFGIIAIKRGMATTEQVRQALKMQKTVAREKGETPFLGTFLQEIAGLSQDDITQILLDQKQIEIRGLDLQKALYSAKEELKIFKRLNQLFAYTVSRDGIEAFVHKLKAADTSVPVYELIIWLRKTGIRFGIFNDDALMEFLRNTPVNAPVLIARGQAAEPAGKEEIQLLFGRETGDGSGDVQECPQPVKRGTTIARLIPGGTGKPGKNVLGHTVYPEKPAAVTIYTGQGVIRKGNNFISVVDGFPHLKNKNTLEITPSVPEASTRRTLTGEINETTDEIHKTADLGAKGTILPEAVIRCNTLHLKGNLLGRVICLGDVVIEGEVGQQDKPSERDASSEEETDATRTEIISSGDVKVSLAVINARILCCGAILAMNACVNGATIVAAKDIVIKEVGPGRSGPSDLRTGLIPDDPLVTADRAIDQKDGELSRLRRETEIHLLKENFEAAFQKAKERELTQAIVKNLTEIIEAPELYQYPGLEDKLTYLYSLPDYSSIKTYYLKIPATPAAAKIVKQLIREYAAKPSLSDTLKVLYKQLDPDEGNPDRMPETQRLQIEYNARLEAFERDAEDNKDTIGQRVKELEALKQTREKLGRAFFRTIARGDTPTIRVKHRCEQGTIIRGILARRVVESTVYNVRFREKLDPRTGQPVIVIEN